MALPLGSEGQAAGAQHEDFDTAHSPGIISCVVICGIVALNICALRLYARLAVRRRLVADDWLFVAAAVRQAWK